VGPFASPGVHCVGVLGNACSFSVVTTIRHVCASTLEGVNVVLKIWVLIVRNADFQWAGFATIGWSDYQVIVQWKFLTHASGSQVIPYSFTRAAGGWMYSVPFLKYGNKPSQTQRSYPKASHAL
jgi:hypothetical protein